jgi:nucleoside-diphosphate-sugar epimerase
VKVFVAGPSGALGRPLVRQLLEDGHEVIGLTRSNTNAAVLEAAGARAVRGNALERGDVLRAVTETRPTAMVEILNALPKRGPIRPGEIAATNELREKATANLLDAARRNNVERFVAESMIFGYGYGDVGPVATEDQPFPVEPPARVFKAALDGLGSLESQVLSASQQGDVQGIALRFGLFYGPGVGSTEFMVKMLRRRLLVLPGGGRGVLSWIHVEDGASAIRAALAEGSAGDVFNVVDDMPVSIGDFAAEMARVLDLPPPRSVPAWVGRLGGKYTALMARTNLRVSNRRIKAELSWEPAYPTFRDGLRSVAADAGRPVQRGATLT